MSMDELLEETNTNLERDTKLLAFLEERQLKLLDKKEGEGYCIILVENVDQVYMVYHYDYATERLYSTDFHYFIDIAYADFNRRN